MCLDSIRLQKYKETLEKCEKENDLKEVISAIDNLLDLAMGSEKFKIKMGASCCVFNFIINGSYFDEEEKETFLLHAFGEAWERTRKKTVH